MNKIHLDPKGFDLPDKSLKEELKNQKLKEYQKMYGIEETKDVVIALASLANQLKISLADGKIQLTELFGFVGALTKFPAAFTGIAQVPNELSELTDEEKEELVALVKVELDLEAEAEAIVEQALKVAYEIKKLVDLF